MDLQDIRRKSALGELDLCHKLLDHAENSKTLEEWINSINIKEFLAAMEKATNDNKEELDRKKAYNDNVDVILVVEFICRLYKFGELETPKTDDGLRVVNNEFDFMFKGLEELLIFTDNGAKLVNIAGKSNAKDKIERTKANWNPGNLGNMFLP